MESISNCLPQRGCTGNILRFFTLLLTLVIPCPCVSSRFVLKMFQLDEQARDAKEIIANGYEVVDIQPFDLFPQTRHIENIMTFQDLRAH